MLTALAWLHPTPLTRNQVATLADISPTSGTFSDYLSALRSAGVIVEEGRGDAGTIALTPAGQQLVAGEHRPRRADVDELLELWGKRS
jgi:hypothetical protein